MKFGVRECCDVVFKAKAAQKVGKKVFYKGEPVCYFDTLKTSTLEGSGSTVYATGGHGNARLMSWDGDRAVTFTMEDALISAEGIMILTGAGLIEAGDNGQKIYQHITETVDANGIDTKTTSGKMTIKLSKKPYLPTDTDKNKDNYAYVMLVKDGEIVSEPYIPIHEDIAETEEDNKSYYILTVPAEKNRIDNNAYALTNPSEDGTYKFPEYDSAIVDYYIERSSNAKQIEITAESFGGNYYVEASTLFRNEAGVDMPAEFIIPNCRVQSNFSFTMASTGDPSSFTFTMDAFPDYTKFDHSKKVLAAIQIIEEGGANKELNRHSTEHESAHDKEFNK